MTGRRTSAISWLLREDAAEHTIAVGERFVINQERYRGTVERVPIGDSLIVFLGTMDVLAPCSLEPSAPMPEPWMSSNVAVAGRVSIAFSDGARTEVDRERAVLFRPVDNRARYDHPPQRKLRLAGYRMRGDRVAHFFDGDVPAAVAALIDPAMARGRMLDMRATASMRRLAQALFSERFNGALRRMFLEGAVLQLMATQVMQAAGEERPARARGSRASIMEARERLLADMRNPPNLAELAAAVGMSERTLNAAFRETFGASVFQVLRNERLEHARLALETTDRPLKDIASRVGYNQVSNFSVAFAARYGVPPRRYARIRTRPLPTAKPPKRPR